MKKLISVLVICLLSTGCATTVGRWVGGGVLTGLGTGTMAATPVVYGATINARSGSEQMTFLAPLISGVAMTIVGIAIMATRSDEQEEHYKMLEDLSTCERRAMKMCQYDTSCYRGFKDSMCKPDRPLAPIPTCYSIFLECKKDKKCYEQNYYKCNIETY